MAMPGMPPTPAPPPGMPSMTGAGPGSTAPAMPMQRESGGKFAKAKVTGGLGLLMLRVASVSAAMSGREGAEFAATLDKHIAGLSKILAEPDRDIGAAELDYMKSQLPGGAQQQQQQGAPPKPMDGMPPTPAPPPGMMPQGAPGGMAA